MNEQEINEIKAKAIMDFASMHVSAFDSGFTSGNTLKVYDVYRSAQNFVKDSFGVETETISEKWDELTAIESRM